MRNILKKRGEFNFEWLFAIVAGTAILILAIYGAVRLSGTFKYQSDSELAKKLSIILDPMQPGFAEGKSSIIEFSQETKINNRCESEDYGSNKITASTRLGAKNWGEPGAEISINNKYLFSSPIGSKKYIVFSKPITIGFKVADFLLMTPEKYCFINPPEEIETDIISFRLENFKINSENCDPDSIRICFGNEENCNMTIRGLCGSCENGYDYGFVERSGQRFYYTGNLLYAAIVSDYNTYNCNVRRIFYRAGKLAELYQQKGQLLAARSCYSTLGPQLETFSQLMITASQLQRFDSVFVSIDLLAKELYNKNNAETCEIW